MILAIDIGNSSITIGIFKGKTLFFKLSIPTHPHKSALTYRNKIKKILQGRKMHLPFECTIISSVVPQLTRVIHKAAEDLSVKKPLITGGSLKTGLVFDVRNSQEVGTDRIVNILAASEAFNPPVLVVDFGTATTISALKRRDFLGGAILPGVGLMGNSLYTGTSKLPRIDFTVLPLRDRSLPAVGKDTIQCIFSGIIYGTAGAVERIILEMERQTGCRFKVVVTGGYADRIVPFMQRKCFYDPDLTLKGLRILYERNS